MRPGLPSRRSLLLWLAGTAASRAGAQPGAVPAWPNRPLRLVLPFGAGGAADFVVRLFAAELQRGLGQPVLVDNQPGAHGNIACAEVAGASDGHTLLIGTVGTHAINPVLSRRLPYDAVRDFAPIGLIAGAPLVLVVNVGVARSLGVRSVADLLRVAAARPGRMNIASGDNGSPAYLAGELFKRLGQIDLLHYPYRSVASARQDVIAGNMDLMFDDLPSALPRIKAGKLVALAVAGARRSPSLPDLPTVEEAGGEALKGFEASAWVGLFAPASQPPEQIARLQHDAAAALAQPGLREQMNALGLQPQGGGARDFAALIATETAKWARIAQLSGVKVDR
ncbi:Bug family tripartite tricarboxylate transporter substrate binding protein [Roseateles saccharophilus]|uniref:Tripartite-type tricarboxylate transporter receptor subunit TctC n=1 Tax=Roseateles saccharophilus TaxID=304 RepID=A0A4R3UHB6_ROSSA|nr:tripartite tricarboxylate transporter substrate binding protein [Roseateles saccharophilus]MDG0833990.1 tripartite tricarboxylate transporter substrate binding protein [Roseateles saccharophilus]TCU90926.1 tripartite-type tricarboxylate transporter receptor subunit TctC [Roseateles saccharophilus]